MRPSPRRWPTSIPAATLYALMAGRPSALPGRLQVTGHGYHPRPARSAGHRHPGRTAFDAGHLAPVPGSEPGPAAAKRRRPARRTRRTTRPARPRLRPGDFHSAVGHAPGRLSSPWTAIRRAERPLRHRGSDDGETRGRDRSLRPRPDRAASGNAAAGRRLGSYRRRATRQPRHRPEASGRPPGAGRFSSTSLHGWRLTALASAVGGACRWLLSPPFFRQLFPVPERDRLRLVRHRDHDRTARRLRYPARAPSARPRRNAGPAPSTSRAQSP